MADMLIIENKAGEQYAVTAGDYRNKKIADGKTYEELGFKPVRHESGAEYSYTPPAAKAESKTSK